MIFLINMRKIFIENFDIISVHRNWDAEIKIHPQVPWVCYTYSCQEPKMNLAFSKHELDRHLQRNHPQRPAVPAKRLR
jgi:hypothetical protein